MAYVPKKSKKPYSVEEDIKKKSKPKSKLRESVKAKKAKDKKKADEAKKKAEEGDWVSRLKTKVKKYLKGERKAKKKEAKK